MATSITTVSTTLEGQFFELAQKLEQGEQAVPAETRVNNVAITPNIDNLTVTVVAVLPIAISTNTSGGFVLTAGTYL